LGLLSLVAGNKEVEGVMNSEVGMRNAENMKPCKTLGLIEVAYAASHRFTKE
jgi:hypothetical protein